MPTERDIEEAKEYIRKRIDAENSMRNNLDRYMREAASRIVDISYRYQIPPEKFKFSFNKRLNEEVDAVINWLKQQIEQASYELATAADEEDKENILSYLSGKTYGKTFPQRNDIYCRRFKYEIEGIIAAGLILGVSKEKLKQSIYTSFRSPYSNIYFKQAISDKSASIRLRSKGISYGVGRTNSMFNALELLSTQTVSQGWMKHWENIHSKSSGFYSYRGSSYPCAHCDDMVGWHPMHEYRGGWHARCKCYFVFTSSNS